MTTQTEEKPRVPENAKGSERAGHAVLRRLRPSRKAVLAYALAGLVVAGSLAALLYFPLAPRVRVYFIAADEVVWDYAPLGRNGATGGDFGLLENYYVGEAPDRIGHRYLKAVLREYLDVNFTTPKPRAEGEEYLGILGPVIRAEVGDTIRVVFKNNARYPFSLYPLGVQYDKASEGAGYDDGAGPGNSLDDGVPPGGIFTYTWHVPERAGPGPGGPSTTLWMYYSHVDPPGDANAGIVGPIVIARKGGLDYLNQNRTIGVDREVFTLWKIFDENRSPYLWDNVARYVRDQAAVEFEIAYTGKESAEGGPCGRQTHPVLQRLCLGESAFVESNMMNTVNGYVYGNMPHPKVKAGELVRWYTFGLGSDEDLHTAHWHGGTLTVYSSTYWPSSADRVDIIELLPGSLKVADMRPDSPGTWLLHCHVDDHYDAGMIALYDVAP